MSTQTLSPYQQRRAERLAAKSDARALPTPRTKRDPETAKDRATERQRRYVEARRRASVILAEKYADEYAALVTTEAAALETERGPLPGDPGYVKRVLI